MKTITPYDSKSPKKQQVEQMFDNIAPKYDLLNHLLSANVDKGWRKKAIKELKEVEPKVMLDIATGTGDLAIQIAQSIDVEQIIAADISDQMLKIGEKKAAKSGLSERIKFTKADSEALPFEGHSFDAISVAFGVRNFENPLKGLQEMHRTLRPGGKVVILEFSKPKPWLVKSVFHLYFKYILPFVGKVISKDNRAYTYLYESVNVFPEKEAFVKLLEQAGYNNCSWRSLTFGICSIYTGYRS